MTVSVRLQYRTIGETLWRDSALEAEAYQLEEPVYTATFTSTASTEYRLAVTSSTITASAGDVAEQPEPPLTRPSLDNYQPTVLIDVSAIRAAATHALARLLPNSSDKKPLPEVQEALSMLVWEVRHRNRPDRTMAFHHAEEVLVTAGVDKDTCDDPIHANVEIMQAWPEHG